MSCNRPHCTLHPLKIGMMQLAARATGLRNRRQCQACSASSGPHGYSQSPHAAGKGTHTRTHGYGALAGGAEGERIQGGGRQRARADEVQARLQLRGRVLPAVQVRKGTTGTQLGTLSALSTLLRTLPSAALGFSAGKGTTGPRRSNVEFVPVSSPPPRPWSAREYSAVQRGPEARRPLRRERVQVAARPVALQRYDPSVATLQSACCNAASRQASSRLLMFRLFVCVFVK